MTNRAPSSRGVGRSPSLAANPRLNTWLTFTSGTVVVHTGKVELGQGITTALVQIAADGLGVAPRQIRVAAANTTEAPDEGYTSGSLSVQHSGTALRGVCAEVRSICSAAAAAVLAVDRHDLRLAHGTFSADGRAVSYWELPTAALLDRDLDAGPNSGAAARSDQSQVGRSLPRVDLLAKLVGAPSYLSDLTMAGQLHARVVRPPSRAARLVDAPSTRAEALPGVYRVIREQDFLAVVSEREETAIRAAELLAADARWDETDTLPAEAALAAFLAETPTQSEILMDRSVEPEPLEPVYTVSSTFTRPYLAHASIGTSTALARWDGRTMLVWTSSQGIYHLRSAIAASLGLDRAAVVVQHVEFAGCYGHNGADDAAYDVALLARAVPDRPIRLVWSRQDELGWTPLGPAMRVRIEAALDPSGRVGDWHHEIWSNGHTSRPGPENPTGLLAYTHQHRTTFRPALDPPLERGGGSGRNALPGYDFPRQSVRTHRLTSMPLRTSALRALGAHLNVFAIESVLDELATAAARDPLEFRLAHLRDPRGRQVLEVVAEHAQWQAVLPPGIGRGIGYARYKGTGAYCAVVAEVEAVNEVRVRRLIMAVDVGTVINPDGVANQIEGGAIQSLSWTLKERVRFDRRHVTSDTWETYPIVTFSEVPPVDIVVVASDDPSLGAGEAAIGPTSAALGNAVAAAVGIRVRDLPITRAAIIRAIEAG